MNPVAKTLIWFGALLIALGLFWQLAGRALPLGRLPGDIVIEGENTRIYFPIVTCLLLSLVLTLAFTVWGWFQR